MTNIIYLKRQPGLLAHRTPSHVLSPIEMLSAAEQLRDQMAVVASTLESIQRRLKQD